MDPRIVSQRRGAVALLIVFVLAIGIASGILLATGLEWVPGTAAQSARSGPVEPSDFLLNTQESFRSIVAAARPAVVSIQAEGTAVADNSWPNMQEPFGWPFDIPDPFGNRGGDQGQQQYEIPLVAAGSGFIVSADGYIITNNHVVSNADQVSVILDDGRRFDAEIVGSDPDTDVAILRISDDEPLPFVELGDSDNLQVGDWVLAVGNPFGNLAGTVTVGIVSAVNREYLNLPNEPYYQNFIQTDAAINLGNSGGPLVDIYGQVVGINTAITAEGSGIGFAIPINMAKFVYDSFRQTGEVVRGWVGVTIQGIDPDLAETLGLPGTDGALVTEVQEGDPAAQAGLQPDDVILEVAGQRITSVQSASRLIASLPVGQPADFLIWRDGNQMTVSVTPSRRDDGVTTGTQSGNNQQTEPQGSTKNEHIGVEVEPLDPQAMGKTDFPEGTQGVVITSVEPNSQAFEKGLREGMVITEINRQPVATADDFDRLVDEAHDTWQNDGTQMLIGFLVYDPSVGWRRQLMALPFEE